MTNLFLDGIYSGNTSPSSVIISFPVANDDSYSMVEIQGLLSSDPSFSAKNSWGPLISNIESLSNFSQLMSSDNVLSLVGASTQAWKSTSPIELGVEFYLINYKRGLDLETKLKQFTKLASVYMSGSFTTKVHGGYTFDVTALNDGGFFKGSHVMGGSFNDDENNDEDKLGGFRNALSSLAKSNTSGTCTVTFGNKKMVIDDLLVARLDVTASSAEVPDNLPLYYRVSAQFVGTKPLLSTKVDSIFR